MRSWVVILALGPKAGQAHWLQRLVTFYECPKQGKMRRGRAQGRTPPLKPHSRPPLPPHTHAHAHPHAHPHAASAPTCTRTLASLPAACLHMLKQRFIHRLVNHCVSESVLCFPQEEAEIKVFATRDVYTVHAPSSASLRDVVKEAVEQASSKVGTLLQPTGVQFMVSGAPVNAWQTRKVGVDALTVMAAEAQSGAFKSEDMLERLNSFAVQLAELIVELQHQKAEAREREAEAGEREAEARKREALANAPRLLNAAAQVLLHACGRIGFRITESNRFTHMGSGHPGVVQLATSMGMEPSDLVKEAAVLLTRRNKHIHPGSLVALDQEVMVVLVLMTPELEHLCPLESKFIRAYEMIKGAFPKSFSD